MDIRKKSIKISNSYYNKGLKMARKKELTQAITYLEKSVFLNYYNIDARNLLGLVYYEIGELSKALVCFIKSVNITDNGKSFEDIYISGDVKNPAFIYIDKIKSDRFDLENKEKSILEYNKALEDVYDAHIDLAILKLINAIEKNPNFIKARNLLTLLYIENREYAKAKNEIDKVLEIDKNNFMALKYLKEVNENIIGATNNNPKKNKETKVILKYSGIHTFINILIGLIIGASSIIYLYMPTYTININNKHNKELATISNELNRVKININKLENDKNTLTKQLEEYKTKEYTSSDKANIFIKEYQLLIATIENVKENKLGMASYLLTSIDIAKIKNIENEYEINIEEIYNKYREMLLPDASKNILTLANKLYDEGNYEKAIVYYDRVLALDTENKIAMLKKGISYKKLGNKEESNDVFARLIEKYPNSNEAKEAKAERKVE